MLPRRITRRHLLPNVLLQPTNASTGFVDPFNDTVSPNACHTVPVPPIDVD